MDAERSTEVPTAGLIVTKAQADGMAAHVLHTLYLTPVYVFGGNDGEEEWGYGLGDATGAQSDCNRAIGHIFRVDDIEDVPGSEQVRIPVLVDDEGLTLLAHDYDADA